MSSPPSTEYGTSHTIDNPISPHIIYLQGEEMSQQPQHGGRRRRQPDPEPPASPQLPEPNTSVQLPGAMPVDTTPGIKTEQLEAPTPATEATYVAPQQEKAPQPERPLYPVTTGPGLEYYIGQPLRHGQHPGHNSPLPDSRAYVIGGRPYYDGQNIPEWGAQNFGESVLHWVNRVYRQVHEDVAKAYQAEGGGTEDQREWIANDTWAHMDRAIGQYHPVFPQGQVVRGVRMGIDRIDEALGEYHAPSTPGGRTHIPGEQPIPWESTVPPNPFQRSGAAPTHQPLRWATQPPGVQPQAQGIRAPAGNPPSGDGSSHSSPPHGGRRPIPFIPPGFPQPQYPQPYPPGPPGGNPPPPPPPGQINIAPGIPQGPQWAYFHSGNWNTQGGYWEQSLFPGAAPRETPKIPVPDKYDGNSRAAADKFIEKCETYFQFKAHMFDYENEVVDFTVQLLDGKAYSWFQPFRGTQTPTAQIWSAFRHYFLQNFGEIDKEQKAAEKLMHLKQTKSVAEYNSEFNDLSARVHWNNKSLIDRYLEGLKPEVIRTAAVIEWGQDILTVQGQADQIDKKLQKANRAERTERPQNQNSSQPRRPQGTRFPPRPNNQSTRPPTGDVKKLTKTELEAQKEYRRKNKLCMYCGSKDHFVKNCDQKPKNISAIEAAEEIIEVPTEGQGKETSAHKSKEKYAVAEIGRYDVIIGRHFLRRHKPHVEWNETTPDRLVFSSEYCSQHCLPFPIDVLGIRDDEEEKYQDIDYLESIPEVIVKEACSMWLSEINSSQSISARIEEGQVKPTQPIEEVVPPALHEYLSVFSEGEASHLPPHQSYDCAIDLEEGADPPFKHLYNMSPKELEALKTQIDSDLAKGWIRHSKSSAGAPVLFVKKKDGKLRMCIDYRGLNAQTKKNRYALPLPSEIMDRVGKAKFFSKLDLRSGYNLVRIKEGDEWKTAFRTRFGHFEYTVMPFGLVNAPATFQHFMNDIFRDMLDESVIIYLDDILIFAETEEELLQKTKEVLRRCKEQGLYCKPEKCEFNCQEIEYLGYIIGRQGIRMDKKKVDAILEWPDPKTVKEIQSFLGFANFYRRFIPNYSKICKPINELLGKDKKFLWGQAQKEAFAELKTMFTTAPLLIWPDFDKPFTVETDCSDYARGAILSQIGQDGKLHPIAYSSKSLTDAEKNYDIYDKELLAIFKAFKEWRHYLQGSAGQITVYTDHLNLETYATTKIPNGRQKRWSQYMEHFDYKIHYRPGKFARPDALSRRPDHEPKEGVEPTPGILNPKHFAMVELDALVVTATDFELQTLLREATAIDPELQKVIGNPPENYEVADGILTHRGKICVPKSTELRRKIVQSRHDSILAGHPGRIHTLELVKRDYEWPSMTKFIFAYVDSCDLCQRTKADHKKTKGTLQPLPEPVGPWTDITFDLITGLPTTKKGHNAILTVCDRKSRRAHYLPTKDTVTAEGIADLFVDHVWKLHGLPERTYSDRGPQFNSRWTRQTYERLQIEPRFSTAYHPQTDGQTERANQEIEQFLRLYTSHRQDDWDQYLALGEFAYNNRLNASIGTTPFFADLGRHPKYTPKRLNV
ncbi:hypothetical protein FRC01_002921 [Tulasnella sp. 417]|nr:hypothetical protein FRC01_002921 [Tulasnella sp. 417]